MAATGLLPFLPGCGSDSSTNPGSPSGNFNPTQGFVQPPEAGGLAGTKLTALFATNVVAGKTVFTRTYEGRIGGPTIRARPGQQLRIRLVNRLPQDPSFPRVADENTPHEFNTTNLHTHGLHVSPEGNSDNIFLEIPPQSEFQYEFNIPANHPAGTFFYHPHKHGSAAMQMFSGMAGALIIEGGVDTVPEVAAARDLVYLINELNIDPATGQVPNFTAGNIFSKANRILTVNGEFRPKLTVQSGEVVRLRVINASVQTHIPFAIDGHSLGVIALDGITLPGLETRAEASLAVAQRADVLVRAGAPGVYSIKKLLETGGMDPDPEELLGTLEVLPGNLSMGLPTTLPAPASLPDIAATELNRPNRTLTFELFTGPNPPLPGGEIFTIDGRLFAASRVDQAVSLNAVEEWTILNRSDDDHPFHLHTNPFQVIAMDGMMLPRPEWHDTMHVPKQMGGTPGSLTLRVRFRDFTGRTVLHCHNVRHEDTGMMQVVQIS